MSEVFKWLRFCMNKSWDSILRSLKKKNLPCRRNMKTLAEMWLTRRLTRIWNDRGCCRALLQHKISEHMKYNVNIETNVSLSNSDFSLIGLSSLWEMWCLFENDTFVHFYYYLIIPHFLIWCLKHETYFSLINKFYYVV